ncbi:MAG: DinB family protein [Hyphomicrobiaceae bacterium]|nr:DinB family protein [Hyphomicrobiaceae bacterium]
MITPSYAAKMAEFNRWINQGLFACCDQLSDADRKKDCGAFFKSIHGTLNHILWADQIWLHRLAEMPAPVAASIAESVNQYDAYDDLKRERVAFDQVICDWAANLDQAALEGDLIWHSTSSDREMTHPRWVLVTHLFNHAIHHRGQVHCLLTQFGVETPTTDLPMMP